MVRDHLATLIATAFYVGYAPIASGTFGTLVAIPLVLLVSGSTAAWVLMFAALFVLGVWSANWTEVLLCKEDPGIVVIDEVAGMFVAVAGIPPENWVWWVLAFFVFRFCDIFKPFPVSRFDEVRGGVGIMMDDIAAGAMSNLALRLLHTFSGGDFLSW